MGLLDRFKKTAEQGPAPDRSTSSSPSEPEVRRAAESSVAQVDGTGGGKGGGLLWRLRQGLKKTTQLLNTDIRDLLKKEGDLLDDEFLDRLYALLVRTDMGVGPAMAIREEIQHQYRGRVVQMDDILAHVKSKLNELVAQPEVPIHFADEGPTVVMVVGVNGSGKTTSIAKLAYSCMTQGKKVVLGAGDTFRAAAVEQLSVWADRIGAELVRGQHASDPASVAHRAVERALQSGADVCIVDTAGRLQTQTNLMEQLSKIRRVMARQIPEAPHEVLLVIDATAGQNGISQAKGFSEAVQCTGIVLAKLDGTAKGGVVIPIRQQFDLPVKFVGVGETVADLAVFDSRQFVEALFADIATTRSHAH
jgi:fused signal recognition particle receptor